MGRVEEIVEKWCPVYKEKSGKKIFSDGLLDSVDFVAIVADIEDEYGIEIPIEEVVQENFDTIENIYEMIRRLKG